MAQPTVAIVTMLPSHPEISRYYRKSASRLGILQIVCGMLSVLCGVVAVIVIWEIGMIGTGIWCGSFFIFSGILGVVSSKSNGSTCHIIAFMVLSIISALFAAVLMIMSVMIMIFSDFNVSSYYSHLEQHIGFACIIIHIILASIQLIVAIISSAICCRDSCGCCKRHQFHGVVNFSITPGQNSELSDTGQQVHVGSVPRGIVYSMPTGGFSVQPLNNQQPDSGVSFPNDNSFVTYSQPPTYSQITVPYQDNDEDKQFLYVPLK